MAYNRLTSIQSNYGGEIKTAEAWRQFIAGGRHKTYRTAANNTTVREVEGGAVAIQLHATDIVIVLASGGFVLNSGGWRSVTTKERINRYTPARLWQDKSVWYIADKTGKPTLFYDGMTIDAEGYPIKPRATLQYEKRLKAIKKQAKVYATGFVAELKNGLVPMPSAGDCWFCAMRPVGSMGSLGDATKNTQHLKDHMAEKYYVPSLLVNAGREAGYRDDQIGLMGIGGHRLFINPQSNIYRYMVKHLMADL